MFQISHSVAYFGRNMVVSFVTGTLNREGTRRLQTPLDLPLGISYNLLLGLYPLGTRRRRDVESTSLTLIQCRNNVATIMNSHDMLLETGTTSL